MRGSGTYTRDGYNKSQHRYTNGNDTMKPVNNTYNRRYHQKKPGGREKGSMFCPYYTIRGDCRFTNDCKNLHTLKLVDSFSLHRGHIDCSIIVHGPNSEMYLFASAPVYVVNAWLFVPGEGNKEVDLKHVKKLEFKLTEEEENYCYEKLLNSKKKKRRKRVCALMYAEECLFTGLDNGIIKVMHLPSSECSTLLAHTDSVLSIICTDGIIISSSISGEVKFWKYEEANLQFITIKTIQTETRIHKMIEVIAPDLGNKTMVNPMGNDMNFMMNNPNTMMMNMNAFNNVGGGISSTNINPSNSNINSLLNRALWVCGDSITIIDLLTLKIVKKIRIDYGPVVSLVQYESNVIVAMADGKIFAYGLNGDERFEMNTFPLYCMAGLTTHENKQILVYGSTKSMYTFSLPDFEAIGHINDRETPALRFNFSDPDFIIALTGAYFIVIFSEGGIAKIFKWESDKN